MDLRKEIQWLMNDRVFYTYPLYYRSQRRTLFSSVAHDDMTEPAYRHPAKPMLFIIAVYQIKQ